MTNSRVTPFLTFNGKAEEAMNFYASSFPDTKIQKLQKYGADHPMAEANDAEKVLIGSLSLMGQEIMFLDMTEKYPAPDFSWASSIAIYCNNEAEFDFIFKNLADGGSVMMGPEEVGPFKKCAWVVDKFGVTWQPLWKS
jgi:predicted 3-demethylubiquinone-9 3-methyltransferase (glyoxalase superfamily)